MKVQWSTAAQADLDRLYSFLAEHDLAAADMTLDLLTDAPAALLDFPRRGPRLSEFSPREVREYRVSRYLVRYELGMGEIRVLRIFHAREDRY